MTPRPDPVPCRCDYCRGVRLHAVEYVRRGAAGPTTRELVCPACESRKPFGVCCPGCGDVRCRTVYTRHRADGSTTRVKKCKHCGRKVRTRETFVSHRV